MGRYNKNLGGVWGSVASLWGDCGDCGVQGISRGRLREWRGELILVAVACLRIHSALMFDQVLKSFTRFVQVFPGLTKFD